MAQKRVTLGGINHASHPYEKGAAAALDHTHQVHIALHPRDPEALEAMFWEVADPTSKKYGKFLSPVELRQFVGMPEDRVMEVVNWLKASGANSVMPYPTNDGVVGSLTAAQISRVFNCSLHWWHFSKAEIVRCAEPTYSVPASLGMIVQGVEGLLDFPMRPDVGGSPVALMGDGQGDVLSVPDMRQVYGVPDGIRASGQSSGAVYGPGFHADDLSTFFSHWAPSQVGEEAFLGGVAQANTGDSEAQLDIEMLAGMSAGVRSYVWDSRGGMVAGVINDAINSGNKPTVLSWSYGLWADESSYKAMDTALQKAGVSGVSCFASSGDSGAVCKDGKLGDSTGYPNSSPFITAVGGTTPTNHEGKWSETAWTNGGGGFAKLRNHASYQSAAIETWRNLPGTVHPPANLYDVSGRGVPDVSAVASMVHIVFQGRDDVVGGTSVASPVVAGIVALLNDILLQKGKSPLGFVNPLFYQNPSMFNDITTGNNWAGQTDGTCGTWTQAYPATTGWDPATGLGTPNFKKMREVIMGESPVPPSPAPSPPSPPGPPPVPPSPPPSKSCEWNSDCPPGQKCYVNAGSSVGICSSSPPWKIIV